MPALEVLTYKTSSRKHSAKEGVLRDFLNVMHDIWRPLVALPSHLHPSRKQLVKVRCLLQEK